MTFDPILKLTYEHLVIKNIFSMFLRLGLKTLLQGGISEPIFYGDLVYKFKRIVGKPNFSDQFKKIVKRYMSQCQNSSNFERSKRQNMN